MVVMGPLFVVAQEAASVGASVIAGSKDGLAVEVKVASPSAQATPLQIACVFEYTEGDITQSPPALPSKLNGLVHVDEALKGLLTELRKSGRFAGHALETLLIIPPAGSMSAERLLLIGLGDRQAFTPSLMKDVGRVGMREALRLGVESYSHASDLKDAGIDSPTGEVAVNVVSGALEAYGTQRFLAERQAGLAPGVQKLTLLAGPAFFGPTQEAVRKVMN